MSCASCTVMRIEQQAAWQANEILSHSRPPYELKAYTPGTGTPESAGLTPREVFPLVRRLCSGNRMVGFDVVELNPLLDPGYTTIMNTGYLVQECLTGIAMRKRGSRTGVIAVRSRWKTNSRIQNEEYDLPADGGAVSSDVIEHLELHLRI